MALLQSLVTLVVDAALGLWLGSIVFFSFVGAPRIFAVLGDAAGDVVNAIFPRYYVFGLGLAVVALLGGLAWGYLDGFGTATLALVALVVVGTVTNAYARWVLIPKMERAGEDGFERYHRQSVVLNGVTMLAVAAGLVASHL